MDSFRLISSILGELSSLDKLLKDSIQKLICCTNFIDRAFCNETSVFEIHYPQSGKDDWFELGFYPMPEENGIVTHVCVRAKNITDKKLLEKKIDKQRKEQKNLLIKATFDAQEKQRTEIGRELHDNVNQVLTTVKLYNEHLVG